LRMSALQTSWWRLRKAHSPGPSSCPYSLECVELDFSQLRAEGVGMLLTHPLKDRCALGAPISCSVILAKKVQAL
jgi:hypothetical protein